MEKNNNNDQPEMRLRLPKKNDGEMFGLAIQLHGGDQIKVYCEDNVERMCRIPGKMKKRVWIREGDVVIIKLWDFQPIKADIVWRYLRIQKERLKSKGLLKNLPID